MFDIFIWQHNYLWHKQPFPPVFWSWSKMHFQLCRFSKHSVCLAMWLGLLHGNANTLTGHWCVFLCFLQALAMGMMTEYYHYIFTTLVSNFTIQSCFAPQRICLWIFISAAFFSESRVHAGGYLCSENTVIFFFWFVLFRYFLNNCWCERSDFFFHTVALFSCKEESAIFFACESNSQHN